MKINKYYFLIKIHVISYLSKSILNIILDERKRERMIIKKKKPLFDALLK